MTTEATKEIMKNPTLPLSTLIEPNSEQRLDELHQGWSIKIGMFLDELADAALKNDPRKWEEGWRHVLEN